MIRPGQRVTRVGQVAPQGIVEKVNEAAAMPQVLVRWGVDGSGDKPRAVLEQFPRDRLRICEPAEIPVINEDEGG